MKDKIMNITVFGHKMYDQSLIVNTIESHLKNAEIPYVLNEETNASVFIKNNIKFAPAIQFDQEDIIPLKVDENFNQSLKKVVNTLLESRGFGKSQNMVVPIDFSENSLNALNYGYKLSFDLGLITTVLHVYFPTSRDLKDSTFSQIDYSKLRKVHLDDLVQLIENEWDNEIKNSPFIQKIFKEGFPGDNIIECSEETNASFILMSTTGDSSFIKKWFGSVSSKVMNESKVPVILIPPHVKYKGIKNIMYAYNSYDIDKMCIDQVINFANKMDSTIHFIHVKKDDDNNPGFYLNDLLKDKISSEKVIINQIQPQEISKALNDYSLTHDIDLIAFGTQQKTLFQQLFKESITKKMLMQSTLPILIVKD